MVFGLTPSASIADANQRLSETVESRAAIAGRLAAARLVPTTGSGVTADARAERLRSEAFSLQSAVRILQDVEETLGAVDRVFQREEEIFDELLSLSQQAQTAAITEQGLLDGQFQALLEEIRELIRNNDFDGRFLLGTDETTAVVAGLTTTLDPFTDARLIVRLPDVERINRPDAGGEANADSRQVGLSNDGRFVSFVSDADNLVVGDVNGNQDAFVFDRQAGTIERVSVSTAGVATTGDVNRLNISGDGNVVTFDTLDNALAAGAGGGRDVFVRDIAAGTTVLGNVDSLGATIANGVSGDVSEDGNVVAFSSNNDGGTVDVAGTAVVDANTVTDAFARNLTTGVTALASVSTAGAQGNDNSDEVRISDDGRFVIFQSDADNLVAGDVNGNQDIFVRDLVNNTTQRVSEFGGVGGDADSSQAQISADGSLIVFRSSSTNFGVGTTGTNKIFARELDTASGTLGAAIEFISVDSTGGQANGFSVDPAVSGDGRFVSFSSAARDLTGLPDTNASQDVFIRDRTLGTTTRVIESGNDDQALEADAASGTTAFNSERGTALSSDGRFIVAGSLATNLAAPDANGVRDIFVRDLTGPIADAGANDDIQLDFQFTAGTAAVTGVTLANPVLSTGGGVNFNNTAALGGIAAGATLTVSDARDFDFTLPGGSDGTAFTVDIDVTADGTTRTFTFGTGTVGALADGQQLAVTLIDGVAPGAATGGGAAGLVNVSLFDVRAGSGILPEDEIQIVVPFGTVEALSAGISDASLVGTANAQAAEGLVVVGQEQLATNRALINAELGRIRAAIGVAGVQIGGNENAAQALVNLDQASDIRGLVSTTFAQELGNDALEEFTRLTLDAVEELSELIDQTLARREPAQGEAGTPPIAPEAVQDPPFL